MDRIRTEYKDDVLKQREEMAKLYQERKVNPLGGCLPVVIQLPIFLVLYYTIRHFDTLESFRTGGLFWFTDLTQPDHLFILPVLYVLTMMASQEITIRNTAPQQKQLMRMLPLVFGAFLAFSGFPSGLFVYWITSNCITFTQNYVIYYVLPHKKPEGIRGEPSPRNRERTPPPTRRTQRPTGRPPRTTSPRNHRKRRRSGRENDVQVSGYRRQASGIAGGSRLGGPYVTR